MRADTGSAIEAISRITEAIGRTHDIQESISAAIEVQTDATRSIETSAETAARSSADIARSVESVALAIEKTVVHPTPGPWRPGRTGRDGLGIGQGGFVRHDNRGSGRTAGGDRTRDRVLDELWADGRAFIAVRAAAVPLESSR